VNTADIFQLQTHVTVEELDNLYLN